MFNPSIENKIKQQIKFEKIIPQISKIEINDELNKIEDDLNKIEIKDDLNKSIISMLKNILGKDDIINSKYNTYYILSEIIQALESEYIKKNELECENDVCIY